MKQDITEVKETNAEKLNARRNKALALRLEGLTDRAIADKLKLSASQVNKDIKNCEEVPLYDNIPEAYAYLTELGKITTKFKAKYIWADRHHKPWKISAFKIQKYKPGEGYYAWHFENNGAASSITRHLVFSTFLNDIKDKGETAFYYQKTKIKARKGKTIIFPAAWTHTHKGITSHTETKYIVTGWYNYIN